MNDYVSETTYNLRVSIGLLAKFSFEWNEQFFPSSYQKKKGLSVFLQGYKSGFLTLSSNFVFFSFPQFLPNSVSWLLSSSKWESDCLP